jgi:hypothetical protein
MKELEIRFREFFFAGRDSGSGLCVFDGEEKLISLFGGFLDAERLRPWRDDTMRIRRSSQHNSLHVMRFNFFCEISVVFAEFSL